MLIFFTPLFTNDFLIFIEGEMAQTSDFNSKKATRCFPIFQYFHRHLKNRHLLKRLKHKESRV